MKKFIRVILSAPLTIAVVPVFVDAGITLVIPQVQQVVNITT